MELKGKKVLVFGSGISGEAAAVLLDREGADIVLYDGNEKLDADRIKSEILEKAVQCGGHPSGTVSVVLGEFPERMLDELDLTVMSPGVPTDLPVVEKMREMGIPVWVRSSSLMCAARETSLPSQVQMERQRLHLFSVRS